ncbi:hypothetical protein GW17_00013587 [Ensete ventricosum]|nr:hypothetical protein GW17_00013587 [Ensete ventricosum]RZS09990.1 hypothetical protein BHM03_00041127 [Ensete ventricosum]
MSYRSYMNLGSSLGIEPRIDDAIGACRAFVGTSLNVLGRLLGTCREITGGSRETRRWRSRRLSVCGSKVRPKSSMAMLLDLSEKDDEPLSHFIARFAIEIQDVPDTHPSLVMHS